MLATALTEVLGDRDRRRTSASFASAVPREETPARPEAAAPGKAADSPAARADAAVPYGDRDIPRNDSIRGRVTDAAGAPVADATVAALFKETRTHPYAIHLASRVRTEPDGYFVLGPLERRTYWVVAVKEKEGVAHAANLQPGAWIDLALAPGARVAGRVTARAGGEPVAGATVVLKDSTFYEETTTDADGRYLLAPLPATLNTWQGQQLVVAADGFLQGERTNLLLQAGREYEIDFALGAGKTLAGKVVDARTLEPVAGAVVGEGWEPYDRTTTTGKDGAYALEHVAVEPNLVFTVRAAGYLPQQSQSDGSGVMDFALNASLQLQGRVLDPKDNPVAGARVYLHRVAYAPGFESATNNQAQNFTTTDADGAYRFPDVLPGQVAVIAFHTDFAPGETEPIEIPIGGPVPDRANVTLRHGLTVEGVVRDANNDPIPSVRVQLSQYGGRIEGYKYARNYIWSNTPVVYSDEEGRFTLEGAVAGRNWLSAWDRNYGWTGAQIEGVEGERITDVIISFAGSSISGVFLAADGTPVAGANVQASGPKNTGKRARGRWTQTDGLGRFRLAGLEPGDYDLSAWTAFGRPEPLRDVPAGTEDVELKLQTTQVLRGEVTSALTGRALDRFQLSIHVPRRNRRGGGGANWQGEVRSPDGRFERPLNPGEYTVIVKASGHAPAMLEKVVVEENIEPQTLFVRLDQGGGLRGTLTDAEGKPVVNGWVRAVIYRAPGEAGEPTDWALGANDRTDSKGRYFLQGLAPGVYLLHVNLGSRGSAQAQVRVRGSEMVAKDLALLPTGTVTLRVVDEEGNPVQNMYFQFRDGTQWLGWARQTNAQGVTTSQPIRSGSAEVTAFHAQYEIEPFSVQILPRKTVQVDVTARKKQR